MQKQRPSCVKHVVFSKCFEKNIPILVKLYMRMVLRRFHTESGYSLQSGLWPTAVFPHAARTPPTTPAYLKQF